MKVMFHNLFVPGSLAKKLVDLGFRQPCLAYWENDGSLVYSHPPYRYPIFDQEVIAPVYQQAIQWLMSKYGLLINVEVSPVLDEKRIFNGYTYFISIWDRQQQMVKTFRNYGRLETDRTWKTYAAAMNHAINKAIFLIKKNEIIIK